jgi:hypothetical protein
MPTPVDFPMLGWLNLPYDTADGYAALFKDAAPEIMGESPYLNCRDAGIAFALDRKDKVIAIFLYAADVEGFVKYRADLPAGLSCCSTRADVNAAMGRAASFSGESGGEGIFAIEHSFDRFEDGPFYIRFEYWLGNAGVRLVTMGLA